MASERRSSTFLSLAPQNYSTWTAPKTEAAVESPAASTSPATKPVLVEPVVKSQRSDSASSDSWRMAQFLSNSSSAEFISKGMWGIGWIRCENGSSGKGKGLSNE
ncbi:hypothetical protein CLAFUW4_04509 [Fulvia fulva]|uniref:Uncharacterized protein n=1 Tax=Passalora fulva TaxID=5499 RepID=A0A9Q8P8L7_PASFU|nr:uncharacterized protein CLAFUR5_04472 [Fulvia fulva]KAK4626764.1 hypothetical protein CLAFUR4_04495 [Fulvia fulva]KAK4628693.1 hypothetical protein CLAFUR0_04498 [Fulvia fulva]UJO17026.1 hypothetical protein CLAFUR5_04472 [Fulvia fulva]WPV13223.1 hypothetical protein CLAFUW4_04509 [Fulvia fulva]WPV28663.1 hypothetical protein CLAFUW7_04501 [Fulvia fulva]